MRAGVALVTLLLLLLGETLTPSVQAQTNHSIRVMTYNIHHGEGLDGKVDLQRIAALIKSEGADIVALQEVDKGVQRTAQRDLPKELADLTGMTCVFSNNFHYQGGEYGNAVLTRFPIKQWSNLHYQMLRTNEQRGILQLTLEAHGRELVFMNTHIDSRHDDGERWMNLAEIEKLKHGCGDTPVILCGDFNSTPDSRIYKRLCETFNDAWPRAGVGDGFTFPAGKPGKRIDYIWLSKSGTLQVSKAWIPESGASDHCPLVAEMTIK